MRGSAAFAGQINFLQCKNGWKYFKKNGSSEKKYSDAADPFWPSRIPQLPKNVNPKMKVIFFALAQQSAHQGLSLLFHVKISITLRPLGRSDGLNCYFWVCLWWLPKTGAWSLPGTGISTHGKQRSLWLGPKYDWHPGKLFNMFCSVFLSALKKCRFTFIEGSSLYARGDCPVVRW
jgi:hypothetical protein